jgi:endonuclease/exonuclease/phosphatase family metal-dependent hydrolase
MQSMPRLKVATYNTYREQKGRDPTLDALLGEELTLVCLQEVSLVRAWEIKRTFGSRAFVSLTKHGLQYLVVVLPEGARFLERRTAQLNGYCGLIPRLWSIRRGYALYRGGRRGWINCLEPRVAQTARVMWRGRTFQMVHTHLPFRALVRNPCLSLLADLLGSESALLVGDLNATTRDLFLADLLMRTGLDSTGRGTATHNSGRRIDYVLYRGDFREVGYAVTRSLSDHRLVRVELEV